MNNSQNSTKTVSKQINVFIRRHLFVISSTERFTTSQRRAFLRDVYDYSRSLGLGKKEAKHQTIKAREICGEDEYNTDETSLENEIDDSNSILISLQEGTRSIPQHSGHTRSGTKRTTVTTNEQPQIAPPSKEPSINHENRKRQATDIKIDGETSQSLTGIQLQTTTKPKNGHSKRSKTRDITASSAGHGNLIEEPKSFTSTSHIYRNSKPDTQENTVAEDSTPRHFTSQNRDLTTSKSSIPATVSTSQNFTKRAHNFASPEVVSFSDDD